MKFCLDLNYQELLLCEKKLAEVVTIFVNLLKDCKRWSEPTDGPVVKVQKDAERKANCYFKLSQQRAISTANYNSQAIITQFLKLTQHTSTIHIPRDGCPGFNIMVTDQDPSIANAASIIQNNKNIPTFSGFTRNIPLNEHKLAAATRQFAVTLNTPPVNFEFYQIMKNTTNSKYRIDPFVIKGIGNIISTTIASTGPSHQQESITTIVSNSTAVTSNSGNNIVARGFSTSTTIVSMELFIPKVVYFCYKSKLEYPEGSKMLQKCFAGIECEHHVNCKYGHTMEEVEKFIENCRRKTGTHKGKDDDKQLIEQSLSTPKTTKSLVSTILDTPTDTSSKSTPVSGEMIAELVGSIGRLINTQQLTQASAQVPRHDSQSKRPRSPSPATRKNDYRERSNQRSIVNYAPQSLSSRFDRNLHSTVNQEEPTRRNGYQTNNQVLNIPTMSPISLSVTQITNELVDNNSLGTTSKEQYRTPRSTVERNSSKMEPKKKRCRRRKWMATKPISLGSLSLPSANIRNQGVNILTVANISRDEMLVLTLGLKYVIPARICDKDDTEIIESLAKFYRKIRLKKYFLLNGIDNYTSSKSAAQLLHQKIKKPNLFEPPHAGIYLEHYIATTKNKMEKLLRKTRYLSHNVDFSASDKMYRIAKELYQRKDIIIKNADKNLGVTVLDRSFYFEEALSERHLGKRNTYFPLKSLPLSETLVTSVTAILQKSNHYLNCYGKMSTFANDILTNLHDECVIPSHIYFIPKIHKSPIALRPICASIGSSTYIASKYLDIVLQPIMKNIKSFIKNSSELVCKLESLQFSPNCYLLEADVENLYPSIIINDGLQSLRMALTYHRWATSDIEFVIELAHWVLTNNYIRFGDRYYLQLIGTAMGTPLAVTFACIHLAIIESETLKLLSDGGQNGPQLYYRYIDDIIAVFEYPEEAETFMKLFNTRRRGIHCPKYLISNTSATFLDLTVFKDARFKSIGKLDVKLFQKPTNKFLFLPTSSFHPAQCTKGWISSYIKRIRLNCSNDIDYDHYKSEFYTHLLNRGYKVSIYKLFQIEYNRNKLIELAMNASKKDKKHDNGPISIFMKHNPRASILKTKCQQILKPSNFVLNDNDCGVIFGPKLRPQLTWTNDTTLANIITRSKLRSEDIPEKYRNYDRYTNF
jgi:hypothetical protein